MPAALSITSSRSASVFTLARDAWTSEGPPDLIRPWKGEEGRREETEGERKINQLSIHNIWAISEGSRYISETMKSSFCSGHGQMIIILKTAVFLYPIFKQ